MCKYKSAFFRIVLWLVISVIIVILLEINSEILSTNLNVSDNKSKIKIVENTLKRQRQDIEYLKSETRLLYKMQLLFEEGFYSIYQDYEQVLANIDELKKRIEKYKSEHALKRDIEKFDALLIRIKKFEGVIKQRNDLLDLAHKQMLEPAIRIQSGKGFGSGVVIASRKIGKYRSIYILTNWHVIANSIGKRANLTVQFMKYDKGERAGFDERTAYIVKYNRQYDLALIKVLDKTLNPQVALIKPNKSKVDVFEEVYAIGSAFGYPPMPSKGILTSKKMMIGGIKHWMISSEIIFGNSGGAIYRYSKARGQYEMIGIACRVTMYRYGIIPHLGVMIPNTHIANFLKKWGFSDIFKD